MHLPARSLFVAAGTANITYEHENSPAPSRSTAHERLIRSSPCTPRTGRCTSACRTRVRSASSRRIYTRTRSFYGDNHPVYAEIRCAPVASAKDGAPHVSELFVGELAAQHAEGRGQITRRRVVGVHDEARRRAARDRRARRSPPADDRRRHRARQRRLRAEASSSACRTSSRWPARRAAPAWPWGLALTGRLGRAGQGPAVTDRPRDGRQLAPVRGLALQPERARRRHGPGGRTRDPHEARPSCSAAAGSATPCSSPSRRRCASTATRSLLRGPPPRRGHLQGRGDPGRHRPGHLDVDAGTPVARRAQDRAMSATSCRASYSVRYGRTRRGSRCRAVVLAHHRHWQRPHGWRPSRTRATASSGHAKPGHIAIVDQLAHAVHDEDLRAVPPEARRALRRARDDRLLLLEPGPAAGSRQLEEPRGLLRQRAPCKKVTDAWVPHCYRGAAVAESGRRVTSGRWLGLGTGHQPTPTRQDRTSTKRAERRWLVWRSRCGSSGRRWALC